MANNRIVRYVTNTALLAVLAAAGIGVYQLGTSGTDVEIQEEAPSYLNDTADNKENEDSAVDAGTSLVEAEMKDERTDTEKEMSGVENTVLADNEDADQTIRTDRRWERSSTECSQYRKCKHFCKCRSSSKAEFFGRYADGMAGRWINPAGL